MLHHRSDVLIDAYTGALLCPWHGPQPGAAWAAGVAPCGCQWVARGRDGLRAIRGGANFATEIAAIAAPGECEVAGTGTIVPKVATSIAPLPDAVTGRHAKFLQVYSVQLRLHGIF